MIVHVTQRHIDNGDRLECQTCPVALAIKEQTGEQYVKVYSNIIKVGKVTYKTTNDVYNFISDFDENIAVEPATFDIGNGYTE